MTLHQVEGINHERLGRWGGWLTGQHATVIAAVGIGHDHASGRVLLARLEDGMSDRELAALLRHVADDLEGGAS